MLDLFPYMFTASQYALKTKEFGSHKLGISTLMQKPLRWCIDKQQSGCCSAFRCVQIDILYNLQLHKKQGGNSNLDCVPRTAVVAMSDGGGEGGGSLVPTLSGGGGSLVPTLSGGGGSLVPTLSTRCATMGGVLSSNFVHQMCHWGGGGRGGSLVPTLSTRCATRGGGP